MDLPWVAAAWLAGLALAAAHPVPGGRPALALGAVIAAAAGQRLPPGGRGRATALLAACLALGALRQATAPTGLPADHVSRLNDGPAVTLRGRIAAEPEQRDRGIDYRVAVQETRTAGGWVESSGLVLAHAARHPRHLYGARVEMRARLATPPVFDGFDYRAWLAARGVHSVASRAAIETLSCCGGNPLRRALIAVRDRGRRAIAAAVPEPEASLATGIVLGDDRGIPDRVEEAFRATNTTHVIAISGSNVALLLGVVLRGLAPWLGRRRSVPPALAVLGLYTALVGADAAVVRAAAMGAVTLVGHYLGRPGRALDALALTALAMTLYRPRYVEDLGFQLSFAATVGLVALTDPLGTLPRVALQRLRAATRPASTAAVRSAGAAGSAGSTAPEGEDRPRRGPGWGAGSGTPREHGVPRCADDTDAAAGDPHGPTCGGDAQGSARAAMRALRTAGAAVGEGVLVTVAAQLTTWPLIARQVGQLSLLGLLANFLIVPAQAAVMVLGSATALLGGIRVEAGRLPGLAAWLPLTWTIRVVEAVAGWPLASATVQPPVPVLALYYLLLAAFARSAWGRPPQPIPPAKAIASAATLETAPPPLPVRSATPAEPGASAAPRGESTEATRRVRAWRAAARLRDCWAPRPSRRPGARWALPAAAVLCATTWSAALYRPDGLLHFHVLDVGQGDAILVVTPSGGRVLVDGGPGPSAVLAGLGRILPPWDRRLDMVVLTHPDDDHVGGLAAVLERYRVETIVEAADSPDTVAASAWRAAVGQEGAGHRRLYAGAELLLDRPRGVSATVLWPDPTADPLPDEGANNRSLVLMLRHGRVRFLLTGDIEQPVEERLLDSGADLRALVLKVAHHGSATSSSPAFLDAVAPGLSLVSVGADNTFGHPAPEVIDRLGRAALVRTDTRGRIEVISDGSDAWLR